ncbi:MAG: EAL domain-containing protein [Lachnospiraceae bacterium]|nr:EAL domain-containing protein [Lachnospiraceae bacterium]
MSYNIQIQTSSILVIILIMLFFFCSKKIGLFTERVFARILIGAFVCLLLDILSVIFICNDDTLPSWLVEASCKLYLASIICMAFAGLDYILTELLSEAMYHKVIRIIFIILPIQSVIVLLMPISWYHKDRIVYSMGPTTTVTYIFAFIYILATIYLIITKRDRLNNRRFIATSSWMALWLVTATVQFLNSYLLIIGFSMMLGVLILFFLLENPASLHDKRVGCFNSHALLLFLDQVFERSEDYCVTSFYFEDTMTDDALGTSSNIMMNTATFLRRYRNIAVYKNIENELVMLSRTKDIAEKVVTEYRDYYRDNLARIAKERSRTKARVSVVTLPDCTLVKSPDTLFSLIHMTREASASTASLVIMNVDDTHLRKYHRYHEIAAEIRSALDEDRLEVFYQPIFSTERNCYVSCEALARIRRADGTLISPGEFIPVAEDTGLIIRIGDRVLEKVCSLLSMHKDVADTLDYIEVNLSVAQFKQADLFDKFVNITSRYGIDPSKINLEITETASIEAKNTLLDTMKLFLDHGVSFSLDDFGKGQSNLMYVVEMPVSIIKLDMDMIKAYFVENKARHVVSTTVKMAHDLGLHVVAEGIESEHELDSMRNENIDFIQGYYFSRPVPSNEFVSLITKAG